VHDFASEKLGRGFKFKAFSWSVVSQLGHDQIATLALDQRADRAVVTGGLDPIALLVSRRDAGR
jgi:hypothetical protein